MPTGWSATVARACVTARSECGVSPAIHYRVAWADDAGLAVQRYFQLFVYHDPNFLISVVVLADRSPGGIVILHKAHRLGTAGKLLPTRQRLAFRHLALENESPIFALRLPLLR